MLRPAPAPWQNPRIVSTLVLVFLAGVSTGALTMRLGFHEKLHPTIAIASREPSREAVLQNFKTKLSLTTEQTDQIAMVLEDYRQYYESLQDQLDDLRATGKNRILQVLDPTQRDKFEKMMTDLAPQLDSGHK
jgi:Spy/CpxP family protein refolding chaperone